MFSLVFFGKLQSFYRLLRYFDGLDVKLNNFCRDFATIEGVDQGNPTEITTSVAPSQMMSSLLIQEKIQRIWREHKRKSLFQLGLVFLATIFNAVSIVTVVNQLLNDTLQIQNFGL